MTDLTLINKLVSLPEDLKREVEDFIDFLKSKSTATVVKKKGRVLGLAKGKIIIKDGFDDPLPDFKEYM